MNCEQYFHSLLVTSRINANQYYLGISSHYLFVTISKYIIM